MVWCRYWQKLVTVIVIMQLLYHCIVAILTLGKLEQTLTLYSLHQTSLNLSSIEYVIYIGLLKPGAHKLNYCNKLPYSAKL